MARSSCSRVFVVLASQVRARGDPRRLPRRRDAEARRPRRGDDARVLPPEARGGRASASSCRSSSSRPGSSSTSRACSRAAPHSCACPSSSPRCSWCAACRRSSTGRSRSAGQLVAGGLLQATSLSLLVVAGQIGVDLGLIRPTNYVALVAAGLLSVIVFPARRAHAAARPRGRQLHRLQAMVPRRLGWREREINSAHRAIRAHNAMPPGF